MNNNNWFIESIESITSTSPTQEEMESLWPSSWPARWKELERTTGVGPKTSTQVILGHIDPAPDLGGGQVLRSAGITDPGLLKYDFQGNLIITWYPDKETARDAFEKGLFSFEGHPFMPSQGLDTLTTGPSGVASVRDLIKSFCPEKIEEVEVGFEKLQEAFSFAREQIPRQKMRYLGEEAVTIFDKRKKATSAVLINNFVMAGSLLLSDALPSGNTKIHSILLNGRDCAFY